MASDKTIALFPGLMFTNPHCVLEKSRHHPFNNDEDDNDEGPWETNPLENPW